VDEAPQRRGCAVEVEFRTSGDICVNEAARAESGVCKRWLLREWVKGTRVCTNGCLDDVRTTSMRRSGVEEEEASTTM